MVRQTSELPAQRRCEVLLLNTKRLSGRSGYQDSGRVKGENPVFSTQVLSRTVGGRFRY